MVAEPLGFGWTSRQCGQQKNVRKGPPQLFAVLESNGTITPLRHKPGFHRKRGKFKPTPFYKDRMMELAGTGNVVVAIQSQIRPTDPERGITIPLAGSGRVLLLRVVW